MGSNSNFVQQQYFLARPSAPLISPTTSTYLASLAASAAVTYANNNSHVSAHTLAKLLECLRGLDKDFMLPKFRYPSASNLNPVQVYVCVPSDDLVQGVSSGLYYYHPLQHSLCAINNNNNNNNDNNSDSSTSVARIASVLGNGSSNGNSNSNSNAMISIFLVTQLSAIEPLYGQPLSLELSLLECGYMSQLLGSQARALNMKVAQERIFEDPQQAAAIKLIKECFNLEATHVPLMQLQIVW